MHAIKVLVDRTLERLLVVLMTLLVLDVLWQVASRYILKSPSSFTDELARFLFIWIGLLGAAYVTGKQMHLAIDLLQSRLTALGRRRLQVLIQLLIILFAVAILVVGGARLVYVTLKLNQTAPALELPLGYVYAVVPLSGLLMTFYALVNLLDARAGRSFQR
jgi:TRAP-type C4-dicarboxylate transport system permease small subunit